MWRCPLFWNNSNIVMRGSVAFKPVFFKSPIDCIGTFRNHVRGAITRRYNAIIISRSIPNMTPLQPLLARSCGLLLLSSLVACAWVDDPVARAMRKVTPYRIEVVQGNFVSKEQVQALRPGMTRNQVKEILGTPLIASVFHADRWDYAFTIQRKGTQPQQRKMSVFFQNDVFFKYEGDELPSESEFAERLTTPEERKQVPRLQATPQELDKFKAQKSGNSAPDTQPDPDAPRKQYPPLEPNAK
jgi:outer membrane protein assembly factor BamE